MANGIQNTLNKIELQKCPLRFFVISQNVLLRIQYQWSRFRTLERKKTYLLTRKKPF